MINKKSFLAKQSSKSYLKAQLHIHTNEDPFDGKNISYSAEGLIFLARQHGYHFISITNHDKAFEGPQLLHLKDCALQNNIVFIPGVEKRIHGKDILLYFDYDCKPNKILDKIKSFDDIRPLKQSGFVKFAIVPHPFFHFHSMGNLINNYLDIIDGIEYSWFYSTPGKYHRNSLFYKYFLNMNTHGEAFARTHHLPLFASGDLHTLDWFDKDFTLIRCDHNLESFYQTAAQIKHYSYTENDLDTIVKIKSDPIQYPFFIAESFKILSKVIQHYCRYPWHFFN